MTILIDSRVGSKDLHKLIPGSILAQMDSCDILFDGIGPDGNELIGIERKTIPDLISCMYDGRLVGYQIPGMQEMVNHIYIILEGIWRHNPVNGILEYMQGRQKGGAVQWRTMTVNGRSIMASDLYGFMNTLSIIGCIPYIQTSSPRETAFAVRSLYAWWQKDWDKHKSLLAVKSQGGVTLQKASVMRRVAAQLPGIGWKRSGQVETHFRTIRKMVNAEEHEWCAIAGIGAKTADKVVREIG